MHVLLALRMQSFKKNTNTNQHCSRKLSVELVAGVVWGLQAYYEQWPLGQMAKLSEAGSGSGLVLFLVPSMHSAALQERVSESSTTL